MNRFSGIEQPGPKTWLGIGIRLLATLFFLALVVSLNRCSLPGTPGPAPTGSSTPVASALAWLHLEVEPEGARVRIDGQVFGPSPLSAELAAGSHSVRVEADGYQVFEQVVELIAGQDAYVRGHLTPIPGYKTPTSVPVLPSAIADTTRPLPDLRIEHAAIELETGASCIYTVTQLGIRLVIENAGSADAGPFSMQIYGVPYWVGDGLAAGQTLSLWLAGAHEGNGDSIILDWDQRVLESDEANNSIPHLLPIPTLPPPCTPVADVEPTQSPTPLSPTSTPLPLATETRRPPTSTTLPSATSPSQSVPTDTPRPSATSTPQPTPTSTPHPPVAVTVREGEVTIPTYPFAPFVRQEWNGTFNLPYAVLDREAYQASGPTPSNARYRTLILENEVLRLTFLPDLGGRLYEVFFKPTGHRETYRNPVLKPSPWGPPEQGWWLAAGGLEWCFPVEEHGYEWGVSWSARVEQDAGGATVYLRDSSATDRARVEVAVRLEAGSGAFSVRPRLENPTGEGLNVKYWTNALLAPGGQNGPSADLRFILPNVVSAVTVHSRGDGFLPDYGQRMSWPFFQGTDMSRLGNWNQWLGFFEDPAQGGFLAVYDTAYDEGMVRVADPAMVRGAKGFGFGWKQPIDAGNWTDDGSSYVEIHSGPAPTFDDTVFIPAGGHVQWTEIWYPVHGLGGLSYANGKGALNLVIQGAQVQMAAVVTRPFSGSVVLLIDRQEQVRKSVSLQPGQSYRDTWTPGDSGFGGGQATLRLESSRGDVLAETSIELP